jgi:hypothetical protein
LFQTREQHLQNISIGFIFSAQSSVLAEIEFNYQLLLITNRLMTLLEPVWLDAQEIKA